MAQQLHDRARSIYTIHSTNNQKRFWSLVKRLRKSYESVATFYANDDLQTTPVTKAEPLINNSIQSSQKKIKNTPIISSP